MTPPRFRPAAGAGKLLGKGYESLHDAAYARPVATRSSVVNKVIGMKYHWTYYKANVGLGVAQMALQSGRSRWR